MKQRHAIDDWKPTEDNNGERRWGTPLVLSLSARGTHATATIVEIASGTRIEGWNIPLSKRLIPLLTAKKREMESLLQFGQLAGAGTRMRELGERVYEHILRPLDLDKLFTDGGYVVNLRCEGLALHIPLEVAFHHRYLFERNVVTFRGTSDPPKRDVKVRRTLIVADPTGRYDSAHRQGRILYDFFRTAGLETTLIARPLRKEVLTDLFSCHDIVHFAGHGVNENGLSGWDIGGEMCTARDLCMGKEVPDLVVSSACGNTLLMGLDLLGAGVTNCVCSRFRIPDRDLTPFMLALYHRLFQGLEIGPSFQGALAGRYRNGELLPAVFTLQGESGTRYEKPHT
jgi:hypothetical protein